MRREMSFSLPVILGSAGKVEDLLRINRYHTGLETNGWETRQLQSRADVTTPIFERMHDRRWQFAPPGGWRD